MVGCRGRGGFGGAAPAARQRRRSGRWPLKTARRAVWAAPYGLRFAAAGIGKRWGWPAVACPCGVEGGFGWAQGARGLWGAAPAARQRRRSGRRPLKTARRAVWAAPYGLRFAAAGIGKRWGWPAVACPCGVEGGFGWAQGARGLWGAAPAARQRRRSGRRPLKTARRAVWAAPYGLRFAAAGIGKYWRSGAAGMEIETIRANFFEIGCQKNGGSFVKNSGSRRNINVGKEGYYEVST